MNCSENSDFLASQISAKESDLECPVCLEISEAPIYTCLEQHIICSKCWIKVISRFGIFKVESGDGNMSGKLNIRYFLYRS